MGYWKNTKDFPLACEALALKVISAANCVPNGRVLDVGHAHGDCLLLHLTHPDVPRPSSLIGVTSLPAHTARTKQRVDEVLAKSSTSKIRTTFICDDAIYRPQSSNHSPAKDINTVHPFALPSQTYTSITAIDCAYHFLTRKDFLRQSFDHLAPHGRIALADMCLAAPPTSSFFHYLHQWALKPVIPLPEENLITPTEYEAMLKEIGYEDVQVEDISRHVFPEFARFLRSRGLKWSLFASIVSGWYGLGGRFVVASGRRPANTI
jgi:cyclopropane fatty-acyl-phospholipid synthase-like methyltransferase